MNAVRPAHDAKRRIVKTYQYKPRTSAGRASKTDPISGVTRTYKKQGDIVLTPRGVVEVNEEGWY